MTKTSNNTRLKQLMRDHSFSHAEISALCCVCKQLVGKWLKPKSHPNFRPMRDNYMQLLEFKIKSAMDRIKP